MKKVFLSLLLLLFVGFTQAKSHSLTLGLWEGITNSPVAKYVFLQIGAKGKHVIYYGNLSSQLQKGNRRFFTDSEIQCVKESCKIELLDKDGKPVKHSLNVVISNERILVVDLVRDKQGQLIFSQQYELRKQKQIPLASYFMKNKEIPESSDKDTIDGIWMGTNFDDASRSIYRLKLSNSSTSYIEKLSLGISGKNSLYSEINFQDIVFNRKRASIEMVNSKTCKIMSLELFLLSNNQLDVYQTCYLKYDIVTTSLLKFYSIR